jgi:uncharacterized membrane protein YbhN (UPF0104 family)
VAISQAEDPQAPLHTTPALDAAAAPWAAWRSRALLLKAGLLLAVTAATVAGLVGWAGAGDVRGLILGVGAGHLLAVALLTLCLPLIHAWRLRVVLAATGYELSWRRSFRLVMATWPVSSLTPAKSGDLLRAYYLRQQVPPTVTVGGLLAERAIDLAVWGTLSLVSSLFFRQPAITLFSAAVLGGVLALLLVLAPRAERLPLPSRWLNRIELLLSSAHALARRPRRFAQLVGLTLLNCLATILVTAILFDAVGARIPFLYTVAALPPTMFASLLPFTLAGMGTRDSMLILLFGEYAGSAQSLSVGILYAFFFRWLLSLLGIPFLQQLTKDDPRQT